MWGRNLYLKQNSPTRLVLASKNVSATIFIPIDLAHIYLHFPVNPGIDPGQKLNPFLGIDWRLGPEVLNPASGTDLMVGSKPGAN